MQQSLEQAASLPQQILVGVAVAGVLSLLLIFLADLFNSKPR